MHASYASIALTAALSVSGLARAGSPAEFLAGFEREARQIEQQFSASPDRGRRFFNTAQGGDWSCASCHRSNPAEPGRHASTGKPIEPMAPAANPERLVSARSVEKWFRRNCNDVLGRSCTPAEKADVIAYLINVKP